MIVDERFLEDLFGKAPIRSTTAITEHIEKVLALYKQCFPHLDFGDTTQALNAMAFILNAEAYLMQVALKKGRDLFAKYRDQFLKHFDFEKTLQKIKPGDKVLFLYSAYAKATKKLSANGVIGKFEAIETFRKIDNNHLNITEDSDVNSVVIKVKIGNDGVISLLVDDLAYFGKWERRLQLVF